jgi:RimJ/RimL family protein N-acetyltransferase
VVNTTFFIKPSNHAKLFVDQVILYPGIFCYLPFGPFESAEDFVEDFYEPFIEKKSDRTLFAVFDKTKRHTDLNDEHPHKLPEAEEGSNEVFAGLIGLLNSSPTNLVTEIGCVVILPSFQRTHVASNATGLLLEYTLNLPSEIPPGLGLRRVVWQANALNNASVDLAKRMGFKLEGVLRWERGLPPGKEETGRISREGDPRRDYVGRDTTLLAFCWDDWEEGGRDKVKLIMQRLK